MKDGYMVLKESGRYAIYTTEADARAAYPKCLIIPTAMLRAAPKMLAALEAVEATHTGRSVGSLLPTAVAPMVRSAIAAARGI